MIKENCRLIASQWFDAFNEHNLEKLLNLYAEDACHYSPKLRLAKPETEGLINGKNSLREWWQDSFVRLPSLTYIPRSFIVGDTGIFMEYVRKVEGEQDLTVGEVLEIKDGLIAASKVYHG